MTAISIAMATYNGAGFLRDQLASFVAQTRRPDELVVSDDCSTDATVRILEDFAAAAPFAVRVERNSVQLGLHRNFERAITLASGDLVLISDQDDVWYPHKVETVAAAFESRPDLLALHHDEHIFDQDSGCILPGTLLERTAHLGGWDVMAAVGNCTAIRRSFLPVLWPFPQEFGYDDWINGLPELLGARLLIDMPLQHWRRHGANASIPSVAEERLSLVRLYRRFGTADPRPGWSIYKDRVAAMKERISERANLVDSLLGSGRAAHAIRLATDRIQLLDRRIALASIPKPRRWLQLLPLWAKGFYQPFSGWRSALKDAFVP